MPLQVLKDLRMSFHKFKVFKFVCIYDKLKYIYRVPHTQSTCIKHFSFVKVESFPLSIYKICILCDVFHGKKCHFNKSCFFASVRRGDVLSAWSGIRPLVLNPNAKDTQSIARNHIIEVSDSNLITIAGRTAFRNTRCLI